MSSFCIVYRAVYEPDETKWQIYPDYKTYADAYEDVISYYQFKGMLVDHAWFIYEVQEDGKKVKLNHDGTRPIVQQHECPSG